MAAAGGSGWTNRFAGRRFRFRHADDDTIVTGGTPVWSD